MANGTVLNVGSGGDSIMDFDDGTFKWQATVCCYATSVVAGSAVLVPITTSTGMPVAQQGSWAVTANAGTNLNTSLLALETGGNLASINTKTPALGQALAAASVPIVLTAAQLTTLTPLTTVAVTIASVPSHAVTNAGTFAVQATQAGTWTVTGAGGTFPVTGTFWQATQPVSLASNVTVVGTGTFTVQAAQSGTWNVGTVTTLTSITNVVHVDDNAGSLTVDNAGTFAVQAAQSGTWTVQPGNTANTTPWLANHSDPAATTGNVTAPDVAISSASGQSSQSILTGTPTANSSVTASVNSATAVGVQVTGTWTGTLAFERSIDGGTTYTPASVFLHGVTGSALASVTANCLAHSNCGGSTHFRVRATAMASGTAAVKIQPSYGPSVVASSVNAGTNLIGQVSASPETGTVYSGTTALTPKFATFSTSSSGATTVVALVASKRIRVLRWRVTSNGATNVKWQSHVTPTDISGLSYLTQYKDVGGGWCPAGHFQTVSGEALDINNSAAVAISGEITYIEV